MRILFLFYLLTNGSGVFSQTSKIIRKPVTVTNSSPLMSFSPEWNKPIYLTCNTAKHATYMSIEEKNVIYILNLMRKNPALFARTVIAKYPSSAGQGWLVNIEEYKSLLDTMLKMRPLNLLQPDKKCYISAQCHAATTGPNGYVGHARIDEDCKKQFYYNGECIDYGYDKALDIIMHLMIDEGVSSLGHRLICISSYSGLGVSIQPHKTYGHMTVMDFVYADY